MTLAPRFLVNFWAGYRVARFVLRLKTLGRGLGAQQAVFAKLMAQIAGTEFGRRHGLTADTNYARFRDAVPPGGYDHFQPLIARMAAGEAGVLVPGHCPLFVETAGSTADTAKLLPAPEALLAHFQHGLRDALFLHAAKAGHAGVFLGRHLHIGASTAVHEVQGSCRTSLDGLFALCLSPWVEANLHAPPPAVSQLPEGAEKITAAALAMLRRDVTLVGGTPDQLCALALAAAGADQSPGPHLPAIWPNLECCLFTGAPLGLFGETLRESLGPAVDLHEVYAAAEGVFAAQDGGANPGLRLFTDAGVFFEFLPLADYTEAALPSSGAKCLPLDKVRSGVDYVLLVTTPAGLCRYALGDIVRFVSTDPPRVQFAGRTALHLNAFGERVSERDLVETLQAVCARNGWSPVNFHVAPYHRRIAAGQTINCHEWWLELGTHTLKTPTANVLAPEFDAELAHRHRDYAAKRADRSMDLPSVRLVMPGVFEQWARERHKTASAGKMPRCRSDRLVADQLAALARFHHATGPAYTPSGSYPPL